MPEIRLTVDADTYEKIMRASVLNEMTIQDVGRILVATGLAEQEARRD